MWTPDKLYPYQRRGIRHILQHPNCMLWEFMGGGKTAQCLTAFSELQERCVSMGALVIAPLRVCQSVWRQEAQKWSHTQHLRFSLIHGTAAQRTAALVRRADIYLINYENLAWLATELQHRYLRHKRYPPFSTVIYDEITKVKNSQSVRVKAWKRLLPYFSRRIGLTGEPAANGYADLFGQYLCVDAGQRLGTSLTAFRDAFLKPHGYQNRGWVITRTGQQQLHQRIADITLELSAEDYLVLPPVMNNFIWVELPTQARKIYDALEKEFFAELDSGAELEVFSEAAKINKLLQCAGGAAYLSPGGSWEEIHKAKIEALQDLVEESAGRPILVGYNYIHEARRIAREFPQSAFFSSKLSERELQETLARWDRDEIPILAGHGKSCGHGLNLQGSSARATVWFSLPWSLDLYNQLNARLFGGHRRQGASVIHHILAKNTMDEAVWAALNSKSTTQDDLRKAVKAYRESKL